MLNSKVSAVSKDEQLSSHCVMNSEQYHVYRGVYGISPYLKCLTPKFSTVFQHICSVKIFTFSLHQKCRCHSKKCQKGPTQTLVGWGGGYHVPSPSLDALGISFDSPSFSEPLRHVFCLHPWKIETDTVLCVVFARCNSDNADGSRLYGNIILPVSVCGISVICVYVLTTK